MSFKKFMQASLLAVSAATLHGCARDISSSSYADSNVGDVSTSYRGMIISARQVNVTGGDNLSDNTAGIVGGGALGALAGSQIGKGRGAVAGAVGIGALGAVAGALAEKELKKQPGMEYTVELQNGKIKTIVQGMEPRFAAGQKVLLMVNPNGRSRVVPDNTAF